MGLDISVGNLAIGDEEGEQRVQQQFLKLSAILATKGVQWSVPDEPALPPGARSHVSGFPYSCLHYLRRAYALKHEGSPVTPVDGGDYRDADDDVKEATSMLSSHLLCHSDAAGYYVPVPVDDPVFLPADSGVDGAGMVGSSQGLLRELRWIAPDIGVRLEPDGTLADTEAERLSRNDDDPYSIERMVWLTLHEACLISIGSGQPIVFH